MWLGLENEETVARTRNCWGWPSSIPSYTGCLQLYWIGNLNWDFWEKKDNLKSLNYLKKCIL